MTKNILVGFDGSPESNEALLWAAAEAAARERPLEIVSCYRLPMATDAYTGTPPDATAAILETVSGEATKARDAVVARHSSLDVSTRVCAGSAAHELVADDGELIVVGASSHRGPSAFWLGSTARAVVRRARCPVVVVRGAAAPAALNASSSGSTTQSRPSPRCVGRPPKPTFTVSPCAWCTRGTTSIRRLQGRVPRLGT